MIERRTRLDSTKNDHNTHDWLHYGMDVGLERLGDHLGRSGVFSGLYHYLG